MKLNGGFSLALVMFALTSTLGWTVYATRKMLDTSERLVAVETRVENVRERLASIERKLNRDMVSIHAGLAELLRLAPKTSER